MDLLIGGGGGTEPVDEDEGGGPVGERIALVGEAVCARAGGGGGVAGVGDPADPPG